MNLPQRKCLDEMICTSLIYQNFIEKFIETAPSNQRQWRMDIQLFLKKEQMNAAPICPSSSFLKHIKPKTVPLELADSISSGQRKSHIEKVITPINEMTKAWKNGGLCPNCALNYKKADFDSCETLSDKLIEGVYEPDQIGNRIQKFGKTFRQSINEFVQKYNCADAQLPHLPQ